MVGRVTPCAPSPFFQTRRARSALPTRRAVRSGLSGIDLCFSAILAYDGAMRLGSLTLRTNLFLSPLAGYTNLPFRLTVREVGGLDLATTDLVNARSLLEKNPKALKLIQTCPADSPLAVQLFGSVPGEMRDAASHIGLTGKRSEFSS